MFASVLICKSSSCVIKGLSNQGCCVTSAINAAESSAAYESCFWVLSRHAVEQITRLSPAVLRMAWCYKCML